MVDITSSLVSHADKTIVDKNDENDRKKNEMILSDDNNSVSTMADLLTAIEQTRLRDKQIDDELQLELVHRHTLMKSLDSLRYYQNDVSLAHAEAEKLEGTIEGSHVHATCISEKVRVLDGAQSRLRQSLERVDLILDLKNSVSTARQALKEHNYELAALNTNRMLAPYRKRQCSRSQSVVVASANDTSVVEDSLAHVFADDFVDDDDEEDQASYSVLLDLENELCSAISAKYAEAQTNGGDDELALRCCKLYALVNCAHRGLVGYCSVLSQQVKASMVKQSLTLDTRPHGEIIPFADMASQVFDNVTQCVMDNANEICNTFGPGSHICLIKQMQAVADEFVADLLQCFMKDRDISPTATKLRLLSRKFDRFTVRSIDDGISDASSNESSMQLHGEIDPRDIDERINEMSQICGEADLFDIDLRKGAERALSILESDNLQLCLQLREHSGANSVSLEHVSRLNEVVQEMLGHYIAFEEYFMLSNLQKAVYLDIEAETQMANKILSKVDCEVSSDMVDEIFYVMRYSSSRAFSTHSLTSVCAVLNYVNHALTGPFRQVLSERLTKAQTARDHTSVSFFADALQASFVQRRELLALNNLDTSIQYSVMLKNHMEAQNDDTFGHTEVPEMVKHCLHDLMQAAKGLKLILKKGILRLVRALQPDLDLHVTKLQSINYEITENEYASNEINDPFVEQLLQALETILHQQKEYLTEANFDSVVLSLASFVATRIEELIFNKKFTFSGGLQIDKDVRRLISFFSRYCQKSIRERFSRLSQLASVLQLYEVSEMIDYWSDGSEHWRLSVEEVKLAMRLRVEFNDAAVNRLQL